MTPRIGDLEKLYQTCKEHIKVFFVYVHEAHVELDSDSGSEELSNSLTARKERVNELRKLGLTMPVLMDQDPFDVQNAYCAFPERIVLISSTGKVVFSLTAFDIESIQAWMENYIKQLPTR